MRPRPDQPDQGRAKITRRRSRPKPEWFNTGVVLNHSPASACCIRQCDKLQQVVQFQLCESANWQARVTTTACAYSSTAVNVSS